jgi:hypothetical protein
MRRNPVGLLSVLGAFYTYLLLRQLGRATAAFMMDARLHLVMNYKVFPRFDMSFNAGALTPARFAVLILAGPGLALAVGYLLLALGTSRTRRPPRGLRLLTCLTSYLCLVLDPIYFAVIPLLHLGGEPETLMGVLGIPPLAMAAPAMALLGLNVILVRSRLVPAIRTGVDPRRL